MKGIPTIDDIEQVDDPATMERLVNLFVLGVAASDAQPIRNRTDAWKVIDTLLLYRGDHPLDRLTRIALEESTQGPWRAEFPEHSHRVLLQWSSGYRLYGYGKTLNWAICRAAMLFARVRTES